jgi:chemotaxis signal transduction protein
MLSPEAKTRQLRLIRCTVGAESYCLPMRWVRSIQRGDLVKPAHPGGDAVGRLAAFGTEIEVYRLADRLGDRGMGRAPAPVGAVVVIDARPRPWGLLVERVARVPAAAPEQLLPLPALAGERAHGLFSGVVRLGDELALCLDPWGLHPASEAPAAAAGVLPSPPAGHRRGRGDGTAAGGRVVLFSTPSDGAPPLRLLLSLTQVEEITRPRPLTRVPASPAHLLGLAPWREAAIPVIDLAAQLGPRQPPRHAPPDPRRAATAATTRLLVARGATSPHAVGFAVRQEVRMMTLPLASRPWRGEPPCDPGLVRGLFELDGAAVAVPDLDRLLDRR